MYPLQVRHAKTNNWIRSLGFVEGENLNNAIDNAKKKWQCLLNEGYNLESIELGSELGVNCGITQDQYNRIIKAEKRYYHD